jgi:hypothetical protein
MKKYFIGLLAIALLLVIQAGIFLPLHLERVNLLLVLLVVVLLFADFEFALSIATTCGILLDFFSGGPDGVISFAFISIFLILYFLINSVLAREATLPILFASVAAATIGYYVLLFIYNQIFTTFGLGQVININSLFIKDLPLSLVLNLVMTYPVLKFYGWVEKINQKIGKNEPEPIQSNS